MTIRTIPPIPDDLWGRINDLLRYAVPHHSRRDQQYARRRLRLILDSNQTLKLPDALRVLGRTRTKDVNGRHIPLAKCHFARIAHGLATEVDQWISDREKRPA